MIKFLDESEKYLNLLRVAYSPHAQVVTKECGLRLQLPLIMALLRRFVTRNGVKLFQPTQNQTKILQRNIVEPFQTRPDKQERDC